MNIFPAPLHTISEFSSESILEAFLAGANDGFLVLDRNGNINIFNQNYKAFHQSYFGGTIEEGISIYSVLEGSRSTEFACNLQKSLDGLQIKYSKKFSLVPAKPVWFDFEFNPLKNKKGLIIGVGVGVFESTENHETADKLRQSEDLFKTLIQNSTDAFQLSNVDFELLFISTTIKNILGFDANELVGRSGLDMVHPDEKDSVVEWFAKVKQHTEKLFSIEYRVKNKEGKWIWIENYASNLLGNPNVQAVVMNLRNIQSKKIADFALIQAEQRLSLLLNNTDESFIILNSRLRIVAYNKAAQQHSPYFYKQELQSGISVLDLVDVLDVEAMINLFEKVYEGDQMEKETSFTDPQNVTHIFSHIFRPLFDQNNEISGVFITSTDITKRKWAELQVKESEERFKTIIQESFDAVLITDETTTIIYSSPSITNVLGYTPEELMGTLAIDYMFKEDLQAAIAKFAEVMISPNSEKNIDVKMRNRNGQYVWIELKGKNMFNNKYVQGILISLRDITSRKKAEEIISLSEQRFKGLVQSGGDMIWIINEAGELIYASPTVQTIMGIDPDTKYGHNVFNQVHLLDADSINGQFRHFVMSGTKQITVGPYRYINDDGQVFWVESTITNMLTDPSIKGIVLNSRDVTDRRKLTEELAANTVRLKTSQKIAKLGYLEYDFRTNKFYCSEEFFEILGQEAYEFKKFNFRSLETIIHPDDRLRVIKQARQAMLQLKDFNAEYRIITRQGQEKIILAIGAAVQDESGKPESFKVTMQDITDSKMAMLALQTMESRFKSLFDNSIDGVILSLEDGEIISANPSICKLLGYTIPQFTELNMNDLFDIASPSISEMISERSLTGRFIGEVIIRNKYGRIIFAEITSLNMKDLNGKNVISTIIKDITDKKKIEEEQKSLTEELLRNNQDLQQFSFITSHNLRAPVANLISLLGLYNRQDMSDAFNKTLIEKFEEATLQLNSTLNDLVNVLVIKSNNNIEKQELLLSDIFNATHRNIENLLLEQNGTVEVDFSEVTNIKYNKIHLDSIFLNLLTNAIRYRSPERAPLIKIKSYRLDNGIVISFADNGLGIDLKRYGDRLFGLYQRFHVSKEGKGLGLYMTKSQVMAMGGNIEVESEPGKGTIFKVFFKS